VLRSNKQGVWSRGVAEALESRILLSRMVIERVGGILGNTVDGFFIPWGPGDQTINGLNEDGGNDQIFITESDDRKITVNPGTGTDLITVGSGDLDHIGSGTIVINAGTDLFQDEVEIQDNSDVGNDTYNVTESGGLIDIVKPNNAGNQVIRVGQTRVKLTVALNLGNDTVNVDSSVSINNTDQELSIDQLDFRDPSVPPNSTTVVFDGTIGTGGTFEFRPTPPNNGVVVHNSLTLNGDTFSGSGSVIAGGTQTLTINDTAATDTYRIRGLGMSLVDGSQTGNISYDSFGDVVLNSQHATAASNFDFQLFDIVMNTPVTVHAGGGNDAFHVGTGLLEPLRSDLVLDGGGGGGDSIEFDDSRQTDDVFGYSLTNNHFHTGAVSGGVPSLSGIENFTLDESRDNDIAVVGSGNTGFISIALNGNEGQDTIEVTPSSTAEYLVDGGISIDLMFILANGAQRGEFSPSSSVAGEYSFSNRHPIFFAGVEQFEHPATFNSLSAPDLLTADDRGRSGTDNITSDPTPSFSGSSAPANTEVVLYSNGVERGSATADNAGAWTTVSTPFPSADASYSMTARVQNANNGLLSTPGPALSVRVDLLVPAVPAAPDLASTSDSGFSSSDNITNDTTPTFSGTVESGATVRLFSGQSQLNSTTLAAAVTAYSMTSSVLPDGVKSITINQEDLAGNVSNASSSLSVTIDTLAPAAPALAPDLQAASDSGASGADDVTNDTTPTFSITAPELVRLQEGGTTLANFVTPPNVTSGTTLLDGVHSIAARSMDLAGNVSALSSALSITIDTVAPAVPATPPDLVDASDTGISATDNLTKDTTPTFAVNSPELATIFSDGVLVADFGSPGGATTPILTASTHAITAEAVDLAGNHSAQTAKLDVTIDITAPATPTIAPDLAAFTDTGLSMSDNVTRHTTPSFNGSVTANDIVRLIEFGAIVGSDTTTSTGLYSASTSVLADGPHLIRARFEDLAGNQSLDGPGLTITVDTTAPAAPTVAPDMTVLSDSGVSNNDDITNNRNPTFTGDRPASTEVVLVEGTSSFGVDIATTNATYSIRSSTLADRAYNMSLAFEDLAGNLSSLGPALNLTIDTVAPELISADFKLVPIQSVALNFSEDVGPTLSLADVQVRNTTPPNAGTIPSAQMSLTTGSSVGTLKFPGVPGAVLASGNYQTTVVAAGITDVAGNPMAADSTSNFFFLNGDANHDAVVDVTDLGILATNWQGTGDFLHGDFNYDGTVDVSDLGILATNWQQSLVPPAVAATKRNRELVATDVAIDL
jgi:hypothetical protein